MPDDAPKPLVTREMRERARSIPNNWLQCWHTFNGVELAVLIDRMNEPVTPTVAAGAGVRFEFPGELLVEGLRVAAGQ